MYAWTPAFAGVTNSNIIWLNHKVCRRLTTPAPAGVMLSRALVALINFLDQRPQRGRDLDRVARRGFHTAQGGGEAGKLSARVFPHVGQRG